MSSQFDLSMWYKTHKLLQTADVNAPETQKHWDQLFASSDSDLVFTMLMQNDDAVQTLRYFYYCKATSPSHTYEVFEGVWEKVAVPRYKNCANVIHQLLSAPSSPTADLQSICHRLDDMLTNHLTDQVFNNWDSRANGDLSWKLLKKIMSFEPNAGDGSWENALDLLDVYLKKGGNWEDANSPYQHILLTQWPYTLMDFGDTTRLEQLFERGVTLKNFNPSTSTYCLRASRPFDATEVYGFYEKTYNSYVSKKITTEISRVSPSVSTPKKM